MRRCEGESMWTKFEQLLDDYEGDIPMTPSELDVELGLGWEELVVTCSDLGAGDCPWFPVCETSTARYEEAMRTGDLF